MSAAALPVTTHVYRGQPANRHAFNVSVYFYGVFFLILLFYLFFLLFFLLRAEFAANAVVFVTDILSMHAQMRRISPDLSALIGYRGGTSDDLITRAGAGVGRKKKKIINTKKTKQRTRPNERNKSADKSSATTGATGGGVVGRKGCRGLRVLSIHTL